MAKTYKEKDGKIILFYIKELDMNQVLKKFREVNYKQEIHIPNNPTPIQMSFLKEDIKRNELKDNLIDKDEDKLKKKIEFLIHILCKRCINNKYGWARLNASAMQKVLGNDYKKIINALQYMNIINVDNRYSIGRHSMAYQITKDYINRVGKYYTTHLTLIKYRDEMDHLLEKEYIKFYNTLPIEKKNLCDSYNRILKNLKFKYINEATEYINTRPYMSNFQKAYYYNILDKYIEHNNDDFRIQSIDDNDRIYSILSSTPKPFKDFLNIKFSIDIKNSHPLLFNYFIYDYYKFINKDIINYILYHYQYDYTTKSINQINRYIKNHKNAKLDKLPKDIIKYIYSTSMGVFWDDFTELFKADGLERKDVKITLFREVFYSKSKTTLHKKFAKTFKKIYPTVYRIINEHKPNDDRTKLSHEMMKLESDIFHKILTNLYKKRGCDALSIHDAIVILDTDKVNRYTPDDIEKVIEKVYDEYNLSPTCSIEFFEPNRRKTQLDMDKSHQGDLFKFTDNLSVSDSDDKELLRKLEEGEVDIYYNNGGIVVDEV
ncbi:hypothetical protein [Dysgonomonas macrotermitis]|uniref:Uncharacterized protein n=1 Tax=Dysgonomonas macrotermitis TaxID=1346286 RepID=A0A1M5C6K4_9BACT|nr:hypothetical protein [Dysgonomonas macrotermitis]SHF50369.1 hypothetical protein SAMN05444362_10751 [Dysgonomonas macrotermitis]